MTDTITFKPERVRRRELLLQFNRDRLEAFESGDAKGFCQFCDQYGFKVPDDPYIFWRAFHRQRVKLAGVSWRRRLYSRIWVALDSATTWLREKAQAMREAREG